MLGFNISKLLEVTEKIESPLQKEIQMFFRLRQNCEDMSWNEENGCWPIRKREMCTYSVSFWDNKNAALEAWGRNKSGLFIGMVQTKHSLQHCLFQTKQLGHLLMCYMHQPWNPSLCSDEGKSSDSIDCLISHIKAVDDEQISCIMSGKDRRDKSW